MLRFSVAPSSRGAMIRISSSGPINDPYLRFVVEAKTSSGRAVREYTVLLDPSNYSMASPSANIVQDVPSYADNNLSSRYRGNAAPIARPQPGILKVKSGSTLRGLAGKVRPRGATLDQTMAALAQANPDAFVDGDVSRLKLGAVLKVPTSRKIKSLSASQVASILGGRPAAPAAEAKAGADVLKLVPSEAGGGNAKLSDLEQQVAAREQALKSAEARITALEDQLKALQAGKPLPAMTSPSSAPAAVPAAASAPVAAASAPAAEAAPSRRRPSTSPRLNRPRRRPAGAVAAGQDHRSPAADWRRRGGSGLAGRAGPAAGASTQGRRIAGLVRQQYQHGAEPRRFVGHGCTLGGRRPFLHEQLHPGGRRHRRGRGRPGGGGRGVHRLWPRRAGRGHPQGCAGQGSIASGSALEVDGNLRRQA